jgi:hypothetical protein
MTAFESIVAFLTEPVTIWRWVFFLFCFCAGMALSTIVGWIRMWLSTR